MKALILCGGKGTRLQPLTKRIAKPLISIANKPVLFYILDQISHANIRDIGIVISPETGESIREVVADGAKWGANISYILQHEAGGLAQAVQTAREFLVDSPFLLFLGDNLVTDNINALIHAFSKFSPAALLMLGEVADPRHFGIAEVDGSGRVICLVEKPDKPNNNLAIIGVYLFTNKIHQAISNIKPSQRGELEITDALQYMIDSGETVRYHSIDGWWFDIGEFENILKANRAVCKEFITRNIGGNVDSRSNVSGRVNIGRRTNIINSIVQGPSTIGENCHIKDSLIGPLTSIGDRTVIDNSVVEGSVVLEYCHIQDVERLVNSIVDSNTDLARHQSNFEGTSLFFGNDIKIEL